MPVVIHRPNRRRRPRHWWEDARHPIWKVAQGIVSIGGLVVLAYHGAEGAHGSGFGIDLSDAAGLGGAALAGKMAWQAWRG